MLLHALSHRDQVSGHFVTRCGLTGYKDTRALLRGDKVGELYDGFATALHERDVDCPGCRITLSSLELLVLRHLYRGARWLTPDDRYSFNRDTDNLYVPVEIIDDLLAKRAIRFDGLRFSKTPLGKSLAERNSK